MAQVRICGGAELERHGWTVNPLVQTERARIGQPQPKTSSSQSYPDIPDGGAKSNKLLKPSSQRKLGPSQGAVLRGLRKQLVP
jgi:hypothetical protein